MDKAKQHNSTRPGQLLFREIFAALGGIQSHDHPFTSGYSVLYLRQNHDGMQSTRIKYWNASVFRSNVVCVSILVNTPLYTPNNYKTHYTVSKNIEYKVM